MLLQNAPATKVHETTASRSHSRSRYWTLAWVAGLFLLVSLLTRLALAIFEADSANFMPLRLAAIVSVGLLYDLAALSYVLLPFVIFALLCTNGRLGRRLHAWLASITLLAGLGGMLFVVVSEFLFWNEFSSRFNFIAVDYLLYTREVIGNIQQSYPVAWILGALALLALMIFGLLRRPVWRAAAGHAGNWRKRAVASVALLCLPALSAWGVDDAPRNAMATPAARELAGNGYYEFMRAFRNNDLDYRAFYKVMPQDAANVLAQHGFDHDGLAAAFTGGRHPLERTIKATPIPAPLHLVMVSMESLGADYVESFGGKPGLTPQLDRLAREGLAFTNLYATGLRTVRGLEALTMSLPPTPGHAVPMRKHNKGFQTLGGVLAEHGYESLYLYGGYGYFDNMADYFGGNGYTVIDRTAIAAEHISHETIWGVADEDLFKHTIREIDRRTADASAGKSVFAHVMTTSNHRPFTYPANRVDIPSGSSRDGAVKYSDWAIGQFIKEASTKPWFKQTLFVFVSDHTSNGRGRTDLPPENYRVPMIVYAPGIVAPAKISSLASQIDVAPTLLAMLGISYTSRFFGHDIVADGPQHPRAFMSNYLTVGYMRDERVVELKPKQVTRVVDIASGATLAATDPRVRGMVDEAVAEYQLAADLLSGRFDTPNRPFVQQRQP
jgi:phosphoglycerol transferase MdoB-like AlkP superfamily enzyme